MADVHLIETPTHGRVLVDRPSVSPTAVLVGCHGYAQTAEILLDELLMIRGDAPWTLVSVQALHRFYTKGDRDVVASWMTRQDRDTAIADNIAYLDRVFDHLDLPSGAVVVWALALACPGSGFDPWWPWHRPRCPGPHWRRGPC